MSTYRVRLLAYDEYVDEDVTFGTCEICMHTGDAVNPTFTMEFTDTETGEESVREVEGWYWSWGDHSTLYLDNVVAFGDWLEDNPITVDSTEMGFSELQSLVYDWEDSKY